MKNLIKRAHFALYILLTAGFSCSNEQPEKSEGWYLKCYYDNNWSWTIVKCDSLQMISTKEAIVWNGGRQTKIYGEELRPLHY